jgi:ATP-binding cassette subfamily B protein
VGLHFGVEIRPAAISYGELDAALKHTAPLLIRISSSREPRFIALVGSRRGRLFLLRPDLGIERVPATTITAILRGPVEAPLRKQVERLIAIAKLAERDCHRAEQALFADLGPAPIDGVWTLRAASGAPFWAELKGIGCLVRVAGLALFHAAQYLLWIGSWWLIGRAALEGRLDAGWLAAWALLLATLVPFQAVTAWLEGSLSIDVGRLLKRRLLCGALRLEPEEVRNDGVGRLMGRVIECEAVEALALTAGFAGLTAGIELMVALALLAFGAARWLPALCLVGWIAVSIGLGRRYWRRRSDWTRARLEITHDLIERMVGHRTRQAQGRSAHRHEGEDEALQRSLDLSHGMDREGVRLAAVVPRGWLLVGVLGLAPAFAAGAVPTVQLAIGVGGILLAYQALRKLTAGLWHVAGAAIAWTQVAPLFDAAARPQSVGAPGFARLAAEGFGRSAAHIPVVEVRDLVFSHRGRAEPALQCRKLVIAAGERVLVEGPSGGGKSTLGALLAGLRVPQSGAILLGGLDRETLGSMAWRRHVALAPQFHENHVLTETFAYNLLMGREWPPRAEDLRDAEGICNELGLNELLTRMPAGLFQMVGETGWRLSHGERSRLYIARALLQGAELVIFDESFAALDPENLQKALACVLKRAPTLMAIGHP